MSFVVAESLAERIAQHISQQIISGELVAQQRIQEARVVAELGVSRGSVREALLLLERRHMVDIVPRKGAMVSSLGAEDVDSLYQLFSTLLTMHIEKVALLWQANQLEPLIEQIKVIVTLAGDQNRIRFMDEVFALMRGSYEIVNNPYLQEVLEDLQPAIHRAYFLAQQYVNNDKKAAQAFFDGMLRCVVERKVESLAKIVNDYIMHQADLVNLALNELEQKNDKI